MAAYMTHILGMHGSLHYSDSHAGIPDGMDKTYLCCNANDVIVSQIQPPNTVDNINATPGYIGCQHGHIRRVYNRPVPTYGGRPIQPKL